MKRQRAELEFQAKLHGYELPEEPVYLDPDQITDYFERLVRATNH